MAADTLPSPTIIAASGGLPVLLSVPHSGREYPDWLLRRAASGRAALESLEDPLVDRLAWRALGAGPAAVIANAGRAGIDCNRDAADIDTSVVALPCPEPSHRARHGLGVVPGRSVLAGPLWRGLVDADDFARRVAHAHAPYHAALAAELARLRSRYGAALLLDLHSMPPPRRGKPQIVFGDRYGRSADRWVTDPARRIAESAGFAVGFNDPYAGGWISERHGNPSSGIHALQVEIDRSCYLDRTLRRPGPGFDRCARLLERLTVELGEIILAQQVPQAAE
ncbi:N-formylglutamate amidohydrolase [Sphingomonas ginkgonis]|uniref:N-formylglutamate amidohydrolase n=1 Tax=Sphingomonas ginkgonis TaxID=2315330 RepID=A0A3R9YLI9_9SPHN|nr:N-formylglutamate amidohydrolase [Sphingomonas ginkgonis]RST30255.1 N-formylglutamate amidohydrolase [Sphingomonas ginkgonis]